MKVLLIGAGGREHAIATALKRSAHLTKLYAAPGNPGIAECATCVDVSGNDATLTFCKKEGIELVIVGPEVPLVEGLADILEAEGIAVFGPSKAAAQLEGSKIFMKDLCREFNIPTAAYGSFNDAKSAHAFIEELPEGKLVVKADGLAAGKGVIIAENKAEAKKATTEMFEGSFGAAGSAIVVEEFLDGEELSFFALCDGKNAVFFGAAQDHKKVGEGDTGPNTGGMGTYSPAPIHTAALETQVMETIINPTMAAMQTRGMPFKGVLFAGLMLTKDGPKLLEYNIRFGDPETQVMMLRLESELLTILYKAATGELAGTTITMKNIAAVCVVMAAKGYPGEVKKGTRIEGLKEAARLPGVTIFHAGTKADGEHILANGGRVLNICAVGNDVKDARDKAYAAVDAVNWPEGFCRRDIAWRALAVTSNK